MAVGGADGGQRHPAGEEGAFELLQPASDPLILRCLEALEDAEGGGADGSPSRGSSSNSKGGGLALAAARAWRRLVGEATDEVRWLPTGCIQLLDTLHKVCVWAQGCLYLPSAIGNVRVCPKAPWLLHAPHVAVCCPLCRCRCGPATP